MTSKRLGNTMMLPPASERLIRPARENYAQGEVAVHYYVALCLLGNSIAPGTAAQFYRPCLVSLLARSRRPGGLGAAHVSLSTPVVAALWPQRNRNASRMNGV